MDRTIDNAVARMSWGLLHPEKTMEILPLIINDLLWAAEKQHSADAMEWIAVLYCMDEFFGLLDRNERLDAMRTWILLAANGSAVKAEEIRDRLPVVKDFVRKQFFPGMETVWDTDYEDP